MHHIYDKSKPVCNNDTCSLNGIPRGAYPFTAILPHPEQYEHQRQDQDKCPDDGRLPGAGLRCGEQYHLVLDQVAGQYVDQTLRDQPDNGPKQVSAWSNVAQRITEIDDIGGNNYIA